MVSISSLADGVAASPAVASACVTVSTAARLFALLVAKNDFSLLARRGGGVLAFLFLSFVVS